MFRGRAALGIAVTLLVAACGSSAGRAAPRPKGPWTALFDGLTVAEGTHLVGPVLIEPAQAPGGERSIAVVSIDTDPVRAYDAYAGQARDAGFPVGGSGTVWSIGQPTCSFVFPGGPRTPFDTAHAPPRALCRCAAVVPTAGTR